MNLPIFNQLLNDQSTYITFSKSLLDLDIAKQNNTEYFYSKMVALKLPDYKEPEFYLDLSSMGISTDNPNMTVPKGMQFYMENIIRQVSNVDEITELAFYKFLKYAGIETPEIVFVNKIATSNMTTVENNNGWVEVVASIPNKCSKLNYNMRTVDIDSIIPVTSGNEDGLFDNGNKEFLFDGSKQVIDFDTITYDETAITDFEFNVLLFFYRDASGVDKLHGINFINPFENKITQFELPLLKQRHNDSRSIGYQFSLNLKTVNNEATLVRIEEYNIETAHWNTYFKTLSALHTLLIRERTPLI